MDESDAVVYDNQVNAAEKILHKFKTSGKHYGLLRADVQSGKTGTYNYLIRLMFEAGIIDNAYIVCGSHELELLSQCQSDRTEWHSNASYYDNIHIVFRQDFDKVTMNTCRSLIVIDETHLVEKVDQTLCKFISNHGLSMAGTTPIMIENHTYMLSVDATPFAEEASMVYNTCLPKFRVVLENGEGYYGPENYYNDNLIKPVYDLSSVEGKHKFVYMLRHFTNKYVLVRIQEKRSKQTEWLKKWAKLAGCDICYFTSKYDKADTQIVVTQSEADEHFVKYGKQILSLEKEPLKTTVVIIDGRLRCGKRVPKKHVGCIWETSKTANTDTIIQSLLGRVCGYLGDDIYNVPFVVDSKPLVFVPERILKRSERRKVIELSDLERYFFKGLDEDGDDSIPIIGPRFGSNIIPGTIQNKPIRDGQEVFQCVPIQFNLNTEQTDSLGISTDLQIKSWCLETLLSSTHLIENNSLLTDEQRAEIRTRLDEICAEDCNIRQYRGTSNQNMYNCHINAYLEKVVSREHISDYPFLTFCVVHGNFIPNHPEMGEDMRVVPGEVYAIFYTQSSGKLEVLDRQTRISKVNNLTHFTA